MYPYYFWYVCCRKEPSAPNERPKTPETERRKPKRLPKPPTVEIRSKSEVLDKGVIEVNHVDPLLQQNGEDHNTDLFEMMWRKEKPQLIVRRGNPFSLRIDLSRLYSEEDDSMSFIFTLKDCVQPSLGQGTLVAVPLQKRDRPLVKEFGMWTAELEWISTSSITVKITPPVNCIIGKWKMEIDTKLSQNLNLNYIYRGFIYILFNPWHIEDEVYLRDSDERNEYVLNESGLMFRGTAERMKPTPWKYSQFDSNILDCALLLVHKVGKIPYTSMSNAVKICRALSASVNSQDDKGVITGNWSEDYSGGKSPTSWTGSADILQKYFKNQKSVKYGQCWVYAGVLTTVCRALGIPARPVTCFESGHDSKGSLTIDYYYDENLRLMEEFTPESIWNYHVWTEVFMKRPDIGHEFNGWQVIDSTPQELSDDLFRCGPASVYGVKIGRILKPYDVDFVYGEVNADVLYWKYESATKPLKLLKTDTKRVGQKILTKAVGEFEKEDITDNYKHPEDSHEERLTMTNALKKSGNVLSRFYLNEIFNEIKFDLQLIDDIVIGSSFNVVLKMLNRSLINDYRVIVTLAISTVSYTGKDRNVVKKIQRDIKVDKKTGDEIIMKITYFEYANKLLEQSAFNVSCLAKVVDTDYEYYSEQDFRVRQPDIKLTVAGDPLVGKPVKIKASFKNPLPVDIRKGKLTIDGPGFVEKPKVKILNAQANSEISAEFILIPKYLGDHTIIAKFTSDELSDVDGYLRVSVNK